MWKCGSLTFIFIPIRRIKKKNEKYENTPEYKNGSDNDGKYLCIFVWTTSSGHTMQYIALLARTQKPRLDYGVILWPGRMGPKRLGPLHVVFLLYQRALTL